MYDCTLGIPDVIKKLYKVVQIEAIRSESETISEKLIKRMLNEKFPFVKIVIDKIKAGKVHEIYDDLKSPSLLKEFVENTKVEVKNKEEARKIIQSQERRERINEKNIVDDLCIFLEGLGHKYSDIEKIAKRVVKKHGFKKEISFLRNELIKEIYRVPSTIKTDVKDKNAKIKNTKDKNNLVKEKLIEDYLKDNIKSFNS